MAGWQHDSLKGRSRRELRTAISSIKLRREGQSKENTVERQRNSIRVGRIPRKKALKRERKN